MFVRLNILKKLMKEAYKTGLVIANSGERILIAGRYWEMDIANYAIPKELMGAIIELVGELPRVGERFSATKDGNQIEIGNLEIEEKDHKTEYVITDFSLITPLGVRQRLLQDYGTGKIRILNEVFINILNYMGIEPGETRPEGPFCDETSALISNNAMRLKARFRIDYENEKILKELEEVDLTPGRIRYDVSETEK